ncbi:MAG: hypothetical protein ABI988_16560 [Nitrospirota bacterium]
MTIRNLAGRGLPRLILAIAASAMVGAGVGVCGTAPASAKCGGFLYFYDGAALTTNPAAAKPAVTINLSLRQDQHIMRNGDQEPDPAPTNAVLHKDQDHANFSFLSGHVLFMDARTRKPEACLSMGKNAHTAWSTPIRRWRLLRTSSKRNLSLF